MITVMKLDDFRRETCLYLTNGALFPEIRGFVRACFADVEGTTFRWSRFWGNFIMVAFVRNRAGVTPADRISRNFRDYRFPNTQKNAWVRMRHHIIRIK